MHTTDSLDKYGLYLKTFPKTLENSIIKNLGLVRFLFCFVFYEISETKISQEENIKVIKFLKDIFVS